MPRPHLIEPAGRTTRHGPAPPGNPPPRRHPARAPSPRSTRGHRQPGRYGPDAAPGPPTADDPPRPPAGTARTTRAKPSPPADPQSSPARLIAEEECVRQGSCGTALANLAASVLINP